MKKLNLNRETLRSLNEANVEFVAGAAAASWPTAIGCPSNINSCRCMSRRGDCVIQ